MTDEKSKNEELIPFGNINIFYTNCVFGDIPLENKFKDDFGGTVLFYKALRNYFGEHQGYNTNMLLAGIFGSPTLVGLSELKSNITHWNGTDILVEGTISVNTIAYGRRIYLADETKSHHHFFFRIGDKRYIIDDPIINVDKLDDNKTYELGCNIFNIGENEKGGYLTIDTPSSKVQTISVIIPKKPFVGDMKIDNFSNHLKAINGDEGIAKSLEEYNEQNPLICKYTGDRVLGHYGLELQSNKFLDVSVIDSLHIDFKKKHTKQELIDLGVKVLYKKV